MRGDVNWIVRACCATAAAVGSCCGTTEPEGTEPPRIAADAPVVATGLRQPAREPRLSVHEGAHAVVGAALGADVLGARIGGADAAQVFFPPRSPVAHQVAMLLAGGIAERWSARWVIHLPDEDLRWFHQRVREVDLGRCDACRAMFLIVTEDQKRSEADVLARWREIEAWTIEIVRRPDIWRSIKRVADALMEHGEIDGEHIKSLVECEPINFI